jgi:hypothetical protein
MAYFSVIQNPRIEGRLAGGNRWPGSMSIWNGSHFNRNSPQLWADLYAPMSWWDSLVIPHNLVYILMVEFS